MADDTLRKGELVDIMPEIGVQFFARREGKWTPVGEPQVLTRRFGDGGAFGSGSIGYNLGGPVNIPDMSGNAVKHSISLNLVEQGSKGMFVPKPEDDKAPADKEARAAARKAQITSRYTRK